MEMDKYSIFEPGAETSLMFTVAPNLRFESGKAIKHKLFDVCLHVKLSTIV